MPVKKYRETGNKATIFLKYNVMGISLDEVKFRVNLTPQEVYIIH
jgi:hypothetical protein